MCDGVARSTVTCSCVWFQPDGPLSLVDVYVQVSPGLTSGAGADCAIADNGKARLNSSAAVLIFS
ncbi:hypothetical protein OKW41_007235 [Paraburkholderia sp. UCT70]